jgi:flagellar hook-length control protein FliK
MSALSSIGGLRAATSGAPVIDQANEPAAVRNGDSKAKDAYQTGLAFEQMLDNILTQQMSATISGTGSGDDGLGGTTSDSGSNPQATAFSSMMPDALTSSLMQSGGTGIAMQIATALDPALANPTPTTAGATGSGVNTPSGGVGLAASPSTTDATAAAAATANPSLTSPAGITAATGAGTSTAVAPGAAVPGTELATEAELSDAAAGLTTDNSASRSSLTDTGTDAGSNADLNVASEVGF